MTGKALVPGPRRPRTHREEAETPKFERVLVRTEEQKKRLEKARKVRDSKKGSVGDFDYEVKVERAKIRDFNVDENGVFVTLSCGFCGEIIEGQGVGAVRSFVEDYLKPFKYPWYLRRRGEEKPRNKEKTFKRTCSSCGFGGISGRISVTIKDKAVKEAKAYRFKGARQEEVFGGVLTFKDFTIEGGKFSRDSYYLGKLYPSVLLYTCGSCGREGFGLPLQKLFRELVEEVSAAWKEGKTVEDKNVDVQFNCPECHNEMKINGKIKVSFPEGRKELIQAFNLWQKDINQLIYEKSRLPLSLDFESAFYEARKAETAES